MKIIMIEVLLWLFTIYQNLSYFFLLLLIKEKKLKKHKSLTKKNYLQNFLK
jgi:hypothetical protein